MEPVSCLSGVSGMVTGLSNLFGGDSGTDPLLEGQRRLIEGQRILMEGQRILMDGQRKLLEGQLAARQALRDAHQDVLENRITLLERTDAIDRRLTAGFDDVLMTLDAVLWDIGQLGRTTIDFSEFGTRLRECENFVTRRAEYGFNADIAFVPRTVEFVLGEFARWPALESHYAANGEFWRPCLRTWVCCCAADPRHVLPAADLRLRECEGGAQCAATRHIPGTRHWEEPPDLTHYVNPGFAPLVRLMSRHYPLQADTDGMRTFCALLNSPLSHAGIDMRGATMFARESCGVPETESPLGGLWRRDGDAATLTVGEWLLHPDAVVELTHLMMELLPYYQITDEENQRLLSAAEVASGVSGKPLDWNQGRVVEIEIVETAYRLVNIAIAQQVLMTGDVFLPLVSRYLFSSQVSPSDRDAVIGVLAHNPVLARNWLVMEAGRQLGLGTNTPTGFADDLDLYRRIFEARRSGGNDADTDLRYERLFPSYWIEETATRGSVTFSQTSNEMVVRGSPNASGTETTSARLPMPTPEHVAARHYSISRAYVELTRLRATIMDYSLRNNLELFGGAELIRNGYFVWH